MPSMHASTGRLFRALAAFEPAPGVLYEVPLRPDEVIELLENDAPDGWLFVRVPRRPRWTSSRGIGLAISPELRLWFK